MSIWIVPEGMSNTVRGSSVTSFTPAVVSSRLGSHAG